MAWRLYCSRLYLLATVLLTTVLMYSLGDKPNFPLKR
ncbi:hypothetical protein V12B01_12890 [Vibrio splendidus 12B01]|nr:hypothetical protein V12B01_12890 [Vibrio splendidus 12B01]